MVHVYRAAVYLAMIAAAVLLYLLLRRLCGKRTRVFPLVAALVAAAGLVWCTHTVLSKPALLVKYAPFLRVKKQKASLKMIYMQSEVRICNLDGSGDEQFLPDGFITTRDITWSPDGTRFLACRVTDSQQGMNLWLYDANGENQFQLTSGPGITRRPSWSPDGTRIVFDFRPNLRQFVTDICVVNVDGSGRQVLLSGDQVHAYHPVWAPDGNSIYCCVKERHRDDLWVMDVDGGNLSQLTFTPEQSETEPAVSPDGGTIAFSVNRRMLYMMDADGGNYRPLADEDGEAYQGRDPSWSPDGLRILFTGFNPAEDMGRTIQDVGRDGSGLRQIPVSGGKPLTPVLKPDGTRLTYLWFVRSVMRTAPNPGKRAGGPGQQ